MPIIVSLHPSPNLSLAAKRRPLAESRAPRARNLLQPRGQNCRSCFQETALAGDRLHRAPAPPPGALPDTAARSPRCLPDRFVPIPSRKLPAPKAKSRSENSRFVAGARAPPKSSASFFRCRSPAPLHESAKAAGPQSLAHVFAAGARPPASVHTPARVKSPRTTRSLPRHTNIWTAAPVALASTTLRAPPPQIRTHVGREEFDRSA